MVICTIDHASRKQKMGIRVFGVEILINIFLRLSSVLDVKKIAPIAGNASTWGE